MSKAIDMLADVGCHRHKFINTMEEKIMCRLEAIERNSLLAAKNVLNLEDVALLTGLSKSHLYKLTSSRQIPHYKQNGKQMWFDRREIEDWQKQNRVTTIAEAEQKAIAHTVMGKSMLDDEKRKRRSV